VGDLILRGRRALLRAYEPLPTDAFKAAAMTRNSQAFAKLEVGDASAGGRMQLDWKEQPT
jgi:hypothetical protein